MQNANVRKLGMGNWNLIAIITPEYVNLVGF